MWFPDLDADKKSDDDRKEKEEAETVAFWGVLNFVILAFVTGAVDNTTGPFNKKEVHIHIHEGNS